MFLLNLPTFVCVALAIIMAVAISTSLYYVVHPFWAKGLSDDTRKTAELVAVRAGVIYGIVIGMMFANVRMEHFQMVQAIESEASALTRLYREIERQGSAEKTSEIRKNIFEYVEFIVEEQWPALKKTGKYPKDSAIQGAEAKLQPVWEYITEKELATKSSILRQLFDQVEHYQMMRLYDFRGSLLPLFWYIAIIGYFVTLSTLYISPPSFRRCTLVALYSSMVAIVLLGIFILSHPYSAAAGVEPGIFKWLLESPSR